MNFNVTYPLSAPVLSIRTPSYENLLLSWTSTKYATHYSIYRGTTIIGETKNTTSFTYTPPDAKPYTYSVRAHNGTQTKISNSVTSALKQLGSPTLRFSASYDGILLSWDRIPDADSYLLYRNDKYVGKIGDTSYFDTSPELSNNVIHSYYVVAQDGSHRSEKSNPVSGYLKVLSKPILSVETGEHAIHLSWNDIPGAKEYELVRDDISLGRFSGLLSYVDTPNDHNEHVYQIIAHNPLQSSPSPEVIGVIPSQFPSYLPIAIAGVLLVLVAAIVLIARNKAGKKGGVNLSSKVTNPSDTPEYAAERPVPAYDQAADIDMLAHLKRKRETLKKVMDDDPEKAHVYERVLKTYDERIQKLEERTK